MDALIYILSTILMASVAFVAGRYRGVTLGKTEPSAPLNHLDQPKVEPAVTTAEVIAAAQSSRPEDEISALFTEHKAALAKKEFP